MTFLYRFPTALLALIVLRLLTWRPRGRLGTWADVWLLSYAALVVWIFSVSSKQLGQRYVLVAFPLLLIFVSGLLDPAGGGRCPLVRRATLGCAILYGLSCLVLAPHDLAHFNALAGGPDRGWQRLIDDVDAGQDLRRLEDFLHARGVSRATALCFGPKGSYVRAPSAPQIRWLHTFASCDALPAHGWVAISVRYLRLRDCAAWRQREPAARIGHTIYVYDLGAGR